MADRLADGLAGENAAISRQNPFNVGCSVGPLTRPVFVRIMSLPAPLPKQLSDLSLHIPLQCLSR